MEQVPSFDQATLEAMVNNLKGLTDAWQTNFLSAAKQQQGLQDKLNEQHLRFVEDQHTLVMRTADQGALVANRAANNAATLDYKTANDHGTLGNLIFGGEIDTTAQGAIGAKTAEEFRSVAKQAVEAAMAAVPGTSAASQGTTGVAQGALQTQTPVELAQVLTNNITVQTAILKALADINNSLGVILVKVTGEAVEVK
jgi:predicted amidohydrolase YtcJ